MIKREPRDVKTNIRHIIYVLLALALFVAVELAIPRPVDWSASFSRSDKIPFGSYVLFNLLDGLFPKKRIMVAHDSAYDTLKNRKLNSVNYIIINSSIDFDKYDTDELMRFVSEGNTAFIAASSFTGELGSRLDLRTEPVDVLADRLGVNFANRSLRTRKDYACRKGTANVRFVSFRKTGTAILGVNNRKGVNYIRIKHGAGALYLSCIPFAYTNYNMLTHGNADYVFKALSYLPAQDTLWDEYYKPSRAMPATPLRYILSREPLKWAYYTGIIGLVLFIAFTARRRQRVIPVITPPENATLEFIKTVGRLYYQHRDHKNIAEKMVLHFYEYLYARYRVDALHRTDDFYRAASVKMGMLEDSVRRLFDLIDAIQASKSISDEDLVRLSRMIEEHAQR